LSDVSRSDRALPRAAYNPYVHGLRGFAALCVFVFHIFSAKVLVLPAVLAGVEAASGALQYGVELFFMISGYVILGSLLRHDSLRTFFADRLLRIYPAFLLPLLLVFVTGPFMRWGFFAGISPGDWLADLLGNLLFLPTIFPVPLAHWAAWSLSYEWAFYLVAAGLVFVGRRQHLAWPLWTAFGIAALGFFNFYPRALFFLPGIAVFLASGWLADNRQFLRFPALALIAFFAAWSMTGVTLSQPASQLLPWVLDGRIVMAVVALAAGSYLFATIVQGEGLLSRLLRARVFIFLGTISYSFYLWHPIVIVALKRVVLERLPEAWQGWGSGILFVSLSTLGSIALGWLSWKVFEVQAARLLKRYVVPPQTAWRTA
jgi:peptidoglycan/LPS O-acetylase OafA/YrhL